MSIIEALTPFVDTLFQIFLYYNKAKVELSYIFNHYYSNYYYFKLICDYTSYSTLKINSFIYDYPIEPIQKNWINKIILFDCKNTHCNTVNLIEHYDYIDSEENVSEHILEKLNNVSDFTTISNLEQVQFLYMIKYDKYYIYKMTTTFLLNENILTIKSVPNCFLVIEYKNEDTQDTCEIDLPRNVFIENNEILSNTFLKRWIDYNNIACSYSNNYLVTITDENFNIFRMKKNNYILLLSSGYTVEEIK